MVAGPGSIYRHNGVGGLGGGGVEGIGARLTPAARSDPTQQHQPSTFLVRSTQYAVRSTAHWTRFTAARTPHSCQMSVALSMLQRIIKVAHVPYSMSNTRVEA